MINALILLGGQRAKKTPFFLKSLTGDFLICTISGTEGQAQPPTANYFLQFHNTVYNTVKNTLISPMPRVGIYIYSL